MNEESSGTCVPCVFVLGLINSDLGSKTLTAAYLEMRSLLSPFPM